MANKIYIFTDGSFQPSISEKIAGWGFVILEDLSWDIDPIYENNGVVKNPSSRQIDGEIEAVCQAVKYLSEVLTQEDKEKFVIEIAHDYNGLGHWARGEWKTNKPLTRGYKGFIEQYIRLGLKLEFVWTKGHDGDYWNEYVDDLATSAVRNY